MTQPQPIELIIRINPNSSIEVEGPLHDPILCYGMIKLGERHLDKHFDKAKQVRAIQVVPGMDNIREN
ncbi:hypothetical protein LCGC14_0725200 [marine sediment metagenome]|uniref:Uncharacterized protein n=1 Tax=marine sediment metagenome TaxID=412755 RepID=A0A0F9SWK8_9ZZZZ